MQIVTLIHIQQQAQKLEQRLTKLTDDLNDVDKPNRRHVDRAIEAWGICSGIILDLDRLDYRVMDD